MAKINKSEIATGLKYAIKTEITHKEMNVLIPLLEKDYRCIDLVKVLNVDLTQLYHLLARLRYKGVIITKPIKGSKASMYSFNESSLNL